MALRYERKYRNVRKNLYADRYIGWGGGNNEKQLKTVTAKEEELTAYLDNSTEELAKLGYDAKSLASVLSSTTESKKFLIFHRHKGKVQYRLHFQAF